MVPGGFLLFFMVSGRQVPRDFRCHLLGMGGGNLARFRVGFSWFQVVFLWFRSDFYGSRWVFWFWDSSR